jgi:hypothetical protein
MGTAPQRNGNIPFDIIRSMFTFSAKIGPTNKHSEEADEEKLCGSTNLP